MNNSVNPALEILERHRQHIKTPLRGRLLAIAVLLSGTLLLIFGGMVTSAAFGGRFGSLPFGWPIIIAITLTLARRLWLRNAFQLLKRDARPPILYLRSFDHDETPGSFTEILGFYFSWRDFEVFKRLFALWISPEARLCPILKTVGPVITFGRKTDLFNVKTACRIKVSQNAWKDLLAELMEVSALIVVDAGKSASLLWEVQRSLAEQNRRKLVIALPVGMLQYRRDGWEYMKMRDQILETVHYALPRFQEDVAFIRFNEKGEPVAQRLLKFLSLPALVLGRIRATFVGVLEDLKIRPHPYRIRTFGFVKKTAVVASLLIVLLFAAAATMVEQQQKIRNFARAEVHRRTILTKGLQDMQSGKISPEQLAVTLRTNVLSQLKTDWKELSEAASSMASDNKVAANVFLKYSSAEIRAVESLIDGLETNKPKQVSAALTELASIDTLLVGLPAPRH